MQHLCLIRKLDSYDTSCWNCFNMCTWYGHLGAKNKNRLSRITNMASKIIGKEQNQLACIYKTQVKQNAQQIASDPVYPLFQEFIKLPSEPCFIPTGIENQVFLSFASQYPCYHNQDQLYWLGMCTHTRNVTPVFRCCKCTYTEIDTHTDKNKQQVWHKHLTTLYTHTYTHTHIYIYIYISTTTIIFVDRQ